MICNCCDAVNSHFTGVPTRRKPKQEHDHERSLLMTLFSSFSKWIKEARDIDVLNSMSDRQLRDIGVTRGTIKQRVKQRGAR